MNAAVQQRPGMVAIDVAAVADRIETDGPAYARVSALDLKALAAFVHRTLEAADRPACGARLAAAFAVAIRAHERLARDWEAFRAGTITEGERIEAEIDFEEAFNTLRTVFEKEFPNGSQ